MRSLIPTRALVVALLTAIAAGCSNSDTVSGPPAGPPPSQPPAQTLAVPYQSQMNTEWCWAASITMIANYYGRGLAQCNVLSAYLSADCCLFPSACDVGAPSMQTIQQGLNLLAGLQSTYVFGAIPLDAVRTEIANGRPIIVGYRGSFGGHVVVINGYDAASNVSILDPFYGTFIVPYGQTFTYNGQFVWSDTIVGIH